MFLILRSIDYCWKMTRQRPVIQNINLSLWNFVLFSVIVKMCWMRQLQWSFLKGSYHTWCIFSVSDPIIFLFPISTEVVTQNWPAKNLILISIHQNRWEVDRITDYQMLGRICIVCSSICLYNTSYHLHGNTGVDGKLNAWGNLSGDK